MSTVPDASFAIPFTLNVTEVVPPMKSPVTEPGPSTTADQTPKRFLVRDTEPLAANPPRRYPDAGEAPRVMVVPAGHVMEKLAPESDDGLHELLEALTVPPPDGLVLKVTIGTAKLAVTVPVPDTVAVLPDTDTDPLVVHPLK